MTLDEAVQALERFYGMLPAPPRDPFALFVWQLLGQRTTAERRDAAMAALRRIPALTPDAVFKAARGKLQAAVALAGPETDQRLRQLDEAVGWFRRCRDGAARMAGSLIASRRAAGSLPGLDEASRGRMLLFAAGHAVAPLDPALLRVAGRLGFGAPGGGGSARREARRVRQAVQRGAGGDAARLGRAVLYLTHHASRACVAGTPHCGVCPLRDGCPGRA